MKIKTLLSDPSNRLSLEDIEQFFINTKANQSLPEIIQMYHIRKFTEKFTDVGIDYFTWYAQRVPAFDRASIFDGYSLRAEQKLFSKTVGMYDQIYFKLSDIRHGYVPAYLNFQENFTEDFMEETDRCYLFPIADNIVAALIGCLEMNGLFKNDKLRNLLKNSPRLTAHIRRIIQFFVVPSQLFGGKTCDIEMVMQKVFELKFYSERYLTSRAQ